MTYWIITFTPSPQTGENPATTIARLLACTEHSEPPAFELTLAAAMSLDVLGDAPASGITSKADRAWPNDDLRALVATEPDWTSEGVRIWRLPNQPATRI